MKLRNALAMLCTGTALASVLATPGIAQESTPGQKCAAIVSFPWRSDTQITGAQEIPANSVRANGNPNGPFLPAHCKVNGVIDARPSDIPGNTLGIGFELRLPDTWNGRFFFQGGGGFDGVVAEANGVITSSTRGLQAAITRGFAVASTDAGHESSHVPPNTDTRAALDPQARIDNGYNAVLQVTLLARQIMTQYYGELPKRSYFVGCSNGGRQGMVATQRYPELFDGIVAGDPAFDLTRANIAWDWNTRILLAIAPKDASGNPVLSQALTDADLTLLSNAIINKCDARDGLADGLISDTVHRCTFDPGVLQCQAGQSSGCLTEAKVNAIRAIYWGPHTSWGQPLYTHWTEGGEAGPTGWRLWLLGSGPASTGGDQTFSTPTSPPNQQAFVSGWMPNVAFTPPEPDFDYLQFNFDTDPQRMGASNSIFTAYRFDEGRFFRQGGKILAYYGMSDPAFSAYDYIDWYRELAARFGGLQQLRDSARLFLIPGMKSLQRRTGARCLRPAHRSRQLGRERHRAGRDCRDRQRVPRAEPTTLRLSRNRGLYRPGQHGRRREFPLRSSSHRQRLGGRSG